MGVNYAYYYGVLNNNGMCVEVQDTSNYILRPDYVPIDSTDLNYIFKYYHPIPATVTSHDDFQGQWYSDAAHTNPWNP